MLYPAYFLNCPPLNTSTRLSIIRLPRDRDITCRCLNTLQFVNIKDNKQKHRAISRDRGDMIIVIKGIVHTWWRSWDDITLNTKCGIQQISSSLFLGNHCNPGFLKNKCEERFSTRKNQGFSINVIGLVTHQQTSPHLRYFFQSAFK